MVPQNKTLSAAQKLQKLKECRVSPIMYEGIRVVAVQTDTDKYNVFVFDAGEGAIVRENREMSASDALVCMQQRIREYSFI